MRIALSLCIVQIYRLAWRSHGSSNADLVQKVNGALQLEYADVKANLIVYNSMQKLMFEHVFLFC